MTEARKKKRHQCRKGSSNCKQKTSSLTAEQPVGFTKTITTSSSEASDAASSWTSLRNLFSCRYQQGTRSMKKKTKRMMTKSCRKFRCSVSLCRTSDGSSFSTPEKKNKKADSRSKFDSSGRSLKAPRNDINGASSTSFSSASSAASITASSSSSWSSSSSSLGASFGAMHLRGFSGCFECNVLADPLSGDPSMRLTISPCAACGKIFIKPEDLELHLIERHAVSELEEGDSSRKIIEIIFRSSWHKSQTPGLKIERILKVQNTQKTISSFEEHRAAIKSRALKLQAKNSRCLADGNELLRFHSTAAAAACALRRHGSTSLCSSTARCGLCSVLRGGFKPDEFGKIRTTATSGAAHRAAAAAAAARISSSDDDDDNPQRAMLVCRVIAGSVKNGEEADGQEWYDSAAGGAGTGGANADELFVFSPRAILPCFLVLYRG